MDELKKRLFIWMKIHNISREDLAKALNCSVSSVNTWLSTRPIPKKRQEQIEAFMDEYQSINYSNIDSSINEPISLTLPDEALETLKQVANAEGMSVRDYIQRETIRTAEYLSKLILSSNLGKE